MQNIQTFSLTIQHKEHITAEAVHDCLEESAARAFDRIVGLSFNSFGTTAQGKKILARLVVEHSALINPAKVEAVLTTPCKSVMVVEVESAD